MGIQIYDQISTIRNCSKVKLHHAFYLGLGLKVVKIDWKIVKVGVHACLSNGHRVVLLGFGLKMPKIALSIVKVGMHSHLPNAHLNQSLNFNSKKLVKSETPLCTFLCVAIKWASKSTFKFVF